MSPCLLFRQVVVIGFKKPIEKIWLELSAEASTAIKTGE